MKGGEGKATGNQPRGDVRDAGARWEPLVLDAPSASPPGRQEVAHGRGPPPRDRPFRRGLLFAVLTLGLYALWWHRVVHKELCGYLGRPDRERWTWAFYAVACLFIWVCILGSVALSVASSMGDLGEISALVARAEVTWLVVAGVLTAGVWALLLFIRYVHRQLEVLQEAKRRLGVPMRTTPLRFFGLYFGGLVFQFVAYRSLQEDYNDVHHEAATERRPKGSPTSRPYL